MAFSSVFYAFYTLQHNHSLFYRDHHIFCRNHSHNLFYHIRNTS